MPNAYFTTPLLFLINIAFGLLLALFALRIIMRATGWEIHHPISQLIFRFTQPPIGWLRRWLPAAVQMVGKVDTATLILLAVIAAIKISLIALIQQTVIAPIPLLFATLSTLVQLFITLLSTSIILQVILSWLSASGGNQNPLSPLVYRTNAPLLKPIQRLLPATGGLDFSPFIALIGLQLLGMLVLPLLR